MSRVFGDDPAEVQLEWDGDDAKLTFWFGPEQHKSRSCLWLSGSHGWHPIKLQRFSGPNAKLFFEEWVVTWFLKDDEHWRVAAGTSRHRHHLDDQPDAKIMYAKDFEVLEATYGPVIRREMFQYEIPEGARGARSATTGAGQ